MLFKRIIFLMVLVLAILGTNNALANAHNHGQHQNHQYTIVSPFDIDKEVQSLHCLIRSHTHQGFCPHAKPESNQTARISTDCGGQTTPTIPNTTSFSNDFGETSFLALNHYAPNKILVSSHISSYRFFIDLLDPPPRAL
jgi:hypothetical protein